MNTPQNITGKSLRAQREQFGLSQAKLAQLSGLSQHILSAFELEKSDLTPQQRTALLAAMADKTSVTALVKREKRYQAHKYTEVPSLPERVAQAHVTPENALYRQLLNQIAQQHGDQSSKTLSALSLFSGCGGFSLGFSAAGFRVKGFLEREADLRAIYRLNFPESLELGGDITELSETQLAAYAQQLGQIDVIFGGPPCQGFSLSGKRAVTDPRNQLFKHYLRWVDVLKPKVAILENVRLLTSMKNEEGGWVRDDIADAFRQHGYQIRHFEINAKDYGVPQHRERVLFLAVRTDMGQAPALPPVMHGEPGADLFGGFAPCRTFADACSDLPYLESGGKSEVQWHEAVSHPAHVVDWLWDVPQGASAHDNADPQKRPPSGYNTTYKRQVWHEPASTVQTTFGMISGCRNVHPIATRSMTIREAARIQSFPDQYQFVGSLGTVRTGIGNAVPPLLAYVLAAHIKQMLQTKD
jgi:DNA (cytosine-5)-methyltransferase 1